MSDIFAFAKIRSDGLWLLTTVTSKAQSGDFMVHVYSKSISKCQSVLNVFVSVTVKNTLFKMCSILAIVSCYMGPAGC